MARETIEVAGGDDHHPSTGQKIVHFSWPDGILSALIVLVIGHVKDDVRTALSAAQIRVKPVDYGADAERDSRFGGFVWNDKVRVGQQMPDDGCNRDVIEGLRINWKCVLKTHGMPPRADLGESLNESGRNLVRFIVIQALVWVKASGDVAMRQALLGEVRLHHYHARGSPSVSEGHV